MDTGRDAKGRCILKDDNITDLTTYLAAHSDEIGQRILSSYPALFGAHEEPSPLLSGMLRTPYPAQTLAIMGVSKRWDLARNANVVVTFSKSWPTRPYFGLTGCGHFMI